MANRWFTQFFGSLEKKPVVLSCKFKVDSTNVNGLGISSLSGPGIQGVYMTTSAAFTGTTHTTVIVDGISSTANLAVGMVLSGSGIVANTTIVAVQSATAITLSVAATASATVSIAYAGVGSPASTGPASGIILVKFQDNYNKYLFGGSQMTSPPSGIDISISGSSVLTRGVAYVITSLGTSTTANWVSMGLPVGMTPAVGVPFIAIATGSGTGTGKVQLASNSGVDSIELYSGPTSTLTSSAATVLGVSSGAYAILQCLRTDAAAITGTTHTTTTIDSLSSSVGLRVGQAISGAGIPLGATIATLPTASSLTLSAAATASASAVPISVYPAQLLAAPVDNSVVHLSFFLSNSSITVQGE